MIWKHAIEKLTNNIGAVLLIVVESKGSSPGRVGFKMLVSGDDKLYGSVGGGIMEHNLVELARKMLDDGPDVLLKNQVHGGGESAEDSGMICAGSQRVALVTMRKNDLPAIKEMSDEGYGLLTVTSGGIAYKKLDRPEQIIPFKNEPEWLYQELIGLKDQLYIFGGGHVSLAVSKLFRELDFGIRVFDNRDIALSTIVHNTYADEISIIDYGDAEDCVPEGSNIYVVIMTAGHENDGLVLEQMIGKELRYLGMMGSQKKVESIFKTLKKTGVEDHELARVDAPIGMKINSETPMEIAVSIAAKVIGFRNGKNK